MIFENNYTTNLIPQIYKHMLSWFLKKKTTLQIYSVSHA